MLSFGYLCLITIELLCLMSHHMDMAYAGGYATMSCYLDHQFVNNWDGIHNNVQTNYFLSGQHSYHDNHREDRRFKWRYCQPASDCSPFTSTSSLSTTWWDSTWDMGCRNINRGNAALIGGYSYHDNHREDRRWTWHCGSLESRFSLRNCVWSNNVNTWDAPINYNCPNDGVIRSIKSGHSNHHEDRYWNFECCRVWDNHCDNCAHTLEEELYYNEELDVIDNNGMHSHNNNKHASVWNGLSSTQQIMTICGIIALFGGLLTGVVICCLRCTKKKFLGVSTNDVEQEEEEEEEVEEELDGIELSEARTELVTTQ